MDDKEAQLTRIYSAKKNFRRAMVAVIAILVVMIIFSLITGATMQSSVVLQAMVVAIGVLIFVPGMTAMNIKCPNCGKSFHKTPIASLFRVQNCQQCGFPENEEESEADEEASDR